MELTLDQQVLLSGLKSNPAFQLMLQLLGEKEQGLLDDLSRIGDAAQAIQKLRWWQMTHRFLEVLRETPETIASELDRLMKEGNLTEEDFWKDAWTKRFGNPSPIERVDPSVVQPMFDPAGNPL